MTEYPQVASDLDLAEPDFENATKVHDWRNHVGVNTVRLWSTFTSRQRRALALDAEEAASKEEWD